MFSCFCVNKFYDVIKIRKIDFYLWKQKNVFSIFEKNTKKKEKGFLFFFFLEILLYFIFNKKWKIEKMSIVFVFFEKNIFKS